MSPILSPWYSPTFISIGAILCVVTGVIASVLVGIYLDRTKRYLQTLRIEAIIATVIFALSLWVVPSCNKYLVGIGLVVAGIATVPVTPLGFVFSIELTHPI